MATYSSIFPPNSLGEALRPIRDLDASGFDELLKAVSGSRSFGLTKEELEALRNRLGSHGANVTFVIGSLSFVYSHIARLVETGMPYRDALSATVDELDKEAKWDEKKEEVKARFEKLFNPEIHQRFRKLQRLQSGFIPNAVGFSTFVDLRPDFGVAQTELKLSGYLPIVQFRIVTDSDNPEEKKIVFQVSETALGELRKAIQRAEDKLAALKSQSPLSKEIVQF